MQFPFRIFGHETPVTPTFETEAAKNAALPGTQATRDIVADGGLGVVLLEGFPDGEAETVGDAGLEFGGGWIAPEIGGWAGWVGAG
mmetsp:Transcript_18987/g.19246  ORF Transcript_18987/g.19246 Transcript_18987/m.19246 type:complete len:86 (-) Transcript_18987:196-453(-)